MGKIIISIFIFCLTYSVFATEYNETAVDKVVTLDGTWEDLGGTEYTDSITLSPYSSEILISTDIYAPQAGGSVKYLDIKATDDTGDGSIGDPYKDIEKVLTYNSTRLKAGDVLVIREGTYPTTVKLTTRGSHIDKRTTLEQRIVVQSYPGETVIIDGTNVVWEQPGNSEWMEGVLSVGKNRDYDIIDGIEIHNSLKIGFLIGNKYGSILNCKAYHTGASGIYITGASNAIIDNNEIEEGTYLGSQEMITIYNSDYVIVSNNYIHHGTNENGHENGLGIDIKSGGRNIEIVGNKVHDVRTHCIYVDSRGDTRGIKIHNNEVYNSEIGNGVQIATEIWNTGDPIAHDIKVYNNIIYNTLNGVRIGYSHNPDGSEFTANYFYDLDIVNNTIYNIRYTGIAYDLNSDVNHSAHNVRISNNILRATGTGSSAFPIYKASTDPGAGVYVDTNILDRNVGDVGDNAIIADPLFIDEDAADFRLKVGSPAIDSGLGSVDIFEPTQDYAGTARPINSVIDIGAYESDQLGVGSVKANAGQDVSICSGESTTLTASGGSTYSWSTGATTTSITVSPSSTKTYTVTATDGSGNSDSDDVIVTVNTVTANAGANVTINEGESTTLSASGGDSYSWSTGATTQSITVSPTVTKGYTVTITKNGCQDTDRVKVTVNPAIVPVTASAGADVSICNGESATLTASGGATYLWSTGATTASIEASPTSTKTYTVTATDGSGNSDSDDVIVTVNSVTANAGTNVTITEGESTTLTASGGDNYSWSNGATTQSITVTPTATKGYTVTATKNGCQDTDRVTVTVNPLIIPVTASAGADVSICNGESATLTASGGATYLWSTGAITASITVSPSSTKTYSVTATDGSGNTGSDDVIVTVNSATANAGANVTINEGESTTLTATGGDTYSWSNGATTQSITVTPTATKGYTVTATKNACQDTDRVTVTVNPINLPVTASAGADVSICNGESATLTASGGATYLWSTGATTASITVSPSSTKTYSVTATDGSGNTGSDEVIVTVNTVTANAGANVTINEGESTTLTASGGDIYSWSNGATTQSITVSPTATKGYTVTVTKNGCQDTDRVTVTVNPAIVPMTASAGTDVAICTGESTTLTASGGTTYLWSTGATTASITISPNTTKTYSVTATDSSGNSDNDDVIVTVNNVTANAGEDKMINVGQTVKLTANGGDTYLWSTGQTTKSITVTPSTTKDYTVTVVQNGCQDTDEIMVFVAYDLTNPPPADAFAGDDISICLGESVTLNASGGDMYTWSTGDTNSNIDVNPTRTTTYTLSATRGGITDTDTVTVSVENCNISALPEDVSISEISIYPNPTSDIVNINIPDLSSDMNVELISSNGSLVYKETINKKSNGFYEIDLSRRLAKGVYFVRLFNADQYFVEKIILN